jgi:ribose/xylose/arabinose/galactoside ABC-type transport system permease subunit
MLVWLTYKSGIPRDIERALIDDFNQLFAGAIIPAVFMIIVIAWLWSYLRRARPPH